MIRFKDWGTCREGSCWFTGVVEVRDAEGRHVGVLCAVCTNKGIKRGSLRPLDGGGVQVVPFRNISAVT